MNKEFYVYIYKDPETLEPIYVGKGKDKRSHQHLKYARLYQKDHRFHDKLREILAENKEPIIEIYEKDLEEKEAYDLEQKLIDEHGVLDYHKQGKLLNVSPVAKPSWLGKSHKLWTDEQKAEHSKLMKAYMANPEVRKKVSEAKKGKPGPKQTPEQIEKKRLRVLGTKNPKGGLAKTGKLNPMFGRKWFNNGEKHSLFIPGTEPKEWKAGKLRRNSS